MTKYFVSFLVIICFFSANVLSQAVQFLDNNDNVLQNGDTVKVYGNHQTSEIIAHVKVKNLTNSTIEVICRKWVTSATSGTQNVFCWANLCYPPNTSVSQPMNIAPNATVNDFSGHFFPNNIASEALIMYTFDVRDADTAWFYVKYDATGQSISANSLDKLNIPYPNPASKEINIPFSLQAGLIGFIEIYDISGKKIMSFKVNASSNLATIPVNSLNDGIYFVHFNVNGIIIGTEKFVVKK